jgi:thiol-disulfide isomerase/thioredoxin
MTSAGLEKRTLSTADLKKAVVVFFGDWCPHCEKFLGRFSGQLHLLTEKGVRIIFVGIPSVEALKQPWKDPTPAEYEIYDSKLRTHGIRLGDQVSLCALGDRVTLGKAAVEGLPAVLAVKEGAERFRGVGQDGLNKLDLADARTLEQFLAIWDERKDEKSEREKKKHKSEAGGKMAAGAGAGTGGRDAAGRGLVDRERASAATEALNSDFDICAHFMSRSGLPVERIPQALAPAPNCWQHQMDAAKTGGSDIPKAQDERRAPDKTRCHHRKAKYRCGCSRNS